MVDAKQARAQGNEFWIQEIRLGLVLRPESQPAAVGATVAAIPENGAHEQELGTARYHDDLVGSNFGTGRVRQPWPVAKSPVIPRPWNALLRRGRGNFFAGSHAANRPL
jgi:hypothetical protein